MLRIPTTTYNPLYDIYKPRIAENINGLKADPGLYQMDVRLASIKSLTNLVSSHYRTQQADYRTQVTDFKQSAQALNKTSAVLTDKEYAWDKNTTQTVAAVQNLVTAYNKVDNVLSADNGTKRSTAVLSGIQKYLAVRQDSFKKIGLTLDEDTGDLTVDKDLLTAALTEDSDKVKSLLGGITGFAANITKVSQEITTKKSSDYLKPPSITDSIDYGLQLKGQSYGYQYGLNPQYSSGLFLDMMA